MIGQLDKLDRTFRKEYRCAIMSKTERLEAFGKEVRRRRMERGFDGKMFAAKINISPQHLSQIETAYDKGGRGPVVPGDDVIEAISDVLSWRVIDIRRMLGHVPDRDADASPIPTSVIEFYEGDVTPEERAFVEQTIAMIGNARLRLPTRLGQ